MKRAGNTCTRLVLFALLWLQIMWRRFLISSTSSLCDIMFGPPHTQLWVDLTYHLTFRTKQSGGDYNLYKGFEPKLILSWQRWGLLCFSLPPGGDKDALLSNLVNKMTSDINTPISHRTFITMPCDRFIRSGPISSTYVNSFENLTSFIRIKEPIHHLCQPPKTAVMHSWMWDCSCNVVCRYASTEEKSLIWTDQYLEAAVHGPRCKK